MSKTGDNLLISREASPALAGAKLDQYLVRFLNSLTMMALNAPTGPAPRFTSIR